MESRDCGQVFLSKPTENVLPFPHLQTETDPVSEMLYFLYVRIPDAGQVLQPSNSESNMEIPEELGDLHATTYR
jgi:hypothetical protein